MFLFLLCFYSFCFSTVIHFAVFAAGGAREYVFIPSVFLFLLFLHCHPLCCVRSRWGKGIMFLFLLCFYSFCFSTVIHFAVFAAGGAREYVFIPSEFLFLLFLHCHPLCCVCSRWGKGICFYSFCVFIPSVSPLSSTLLCLQQVGQGNMFLFLLCFYSFCFSTVIHFAVFAAGEIRGYVFIPSFYTPV